MLQWVKDLIELRRCNVDLNDGDFGHLKVSSSHEGKALTMQRGAVRVIMYLGEGEMTCPLLEDETLRLCSRPEIAAKGNQVLLPKMSLAILIRS